MYPEAAFKWRDHQRAATLHETQKDTVTLVSL